MNTVSDDSGASSGGAPGTGEDDGTILAHPGWREWMSSVVVYPLAALLGTTFISLGMDRVYPAFLSDDDFAANRLRMGVVFVAILGALVAWTVRMNRKHRYYALHRDRLTVGRPPRITLRVDDMTRIRVGAPIPRAVRKVARLNAWMGKISSSNARAAQHLTASYAHAVVIDTIGGSLVIHVGTVVGGHDLLTALIGRHADLVSAPAYTPEELARFGRFKAGFYTS